MLRKLHTLRFAPHHSPLREQRLVFVTRPGSAEEHSTTEGQPVQPRMSSVLQEQKACREELFNVLGGKKGRRFLGRNKGNPLLQQAWRNGLDRVDQQRNTEVVSVVKETRKNIIQQARIELDEMHELLGAMRSATQIVHDEKAAARFLDEHKELIQQRYNIDPTLRASENIRDIQLAITKDINALSSVLLHEKTGIKRSFLNTSEFHSAYEKAFGKHEGPIATNAFRDRDTVYFNIEHRSFHDPEHGKLVAERAFIHEVTHVAVGRMRQGNDLHRWIGALKRNAQWNTLVEAVERVFKNNPQYLSMSGTKKDRRIVDEALAIYITNKQAPLEAPGESLSAQKEVCQVLESMIGNPPRKEFAEKINALESAVSSIVKEDKELGHGSTKLALAVEDATLHENLRGKIDDRKREISRAVNDGNLSAATNSNDLDGLAAQELNEMQEEHAKAPEKVTPDKIVASVASNRKKIEIIRKALAKDGAVGKEIKDPESKAALDANLEFLSQLGTDLLLVEKHAQHLKNWDRSEKNGGLSLQEKNRIAEQYFSSNPYAELGSNPNESSIDTADAACAEDRQSMLDVMQNAVGTKQKALEKLEKMIDQAPKNAEGGEGAGVVNWFKKVNSKISWLTIYDMIAIVGIYKNAIVQNYDTNHKVIQNKFAKNLNIYQPIQHTLNRLARSSNSEETSAFAEYIKKEGFTFEDVFGKNGRGTESGLLYENRHNFNRAKAVIEYAADKAWLYFLDRLDGRNVYGIDYIDEDGEQSFEELVNQHESGKSHAIEHGIARVDKDPDVGPIMLAMEHELHHKNIFAVQGIMKRLQDKAKFSHSNTLMLTTLLMYIRDHSKHDPTLRLCLDKGMIDNISNHTITQSAWSITWLKMKRHAIEQWKNGDGEKPEFGNNIATKTMERIEERLVECGAKFPDDDKGRRRKYEAIAMVLSGKTLGGSSKEAVEEQGGNGIFEYGWKHGSTISIFENEFNDYRAEFQSATNSSTCDPGNTDNDYFNPAYGGSDVILLEAGQMAKILQKKSTADWDHGEKARGFFSQVFNRFDELQKDNPEAARNFQKEMREKFDYWWDTGMDKGRKPTFIKDRDIEKRLCAEELEKRDLVSQSVKDNFKTLRNGKE